MEYSKTLQKPLRDKIKNGDTIGALEELEVILGESNDEAILQISKLNKFKKDNRKGTISHSDFQLEVNKINNATLELIKEIPEEKAKKYIKANATLSDILILCRKGSRVKEMEKLFPCHFFPNTVVIPEEDLNEQNPKKYKVIIFDDFPMEEYPVGITHGLQDILDNTNRYVLVYSPDKIRELHENYANRVYFSNSPFSIHSRLNEMFLFLKMQIFNNDDSNDETSE